MNNDEKRPLENEDEEKTIEKETIGEPPTISNPFDPNDISIAQKTLSLDNIIKRIRNNEIDLSPDFQRNPNLWDEGKQSRLIESILINIPLPLFYFDAAETKKWEVVDGLQRLNTLENFIVKENLKLTGLEFLEDIDGKSFSELHRSYQRKIEETQVLVYLIEPGTPSPVKLNVFKRINTGGLVLTQQEMRHAIYPGSSAKFVQKLADSKEFETAIYGRVKKERMEDRELVTRFLAFYLFDYEKDYKDMGLNNFMDLAMERLAELSQKEKKLTEKQFCEALNLVFKIFGEHSFCKSSENRRLNKALFEAWTCSLAKLSLEDKTKLRTNKTCREKLARSFYKMAKENEDFNKSTINSTGSLYNIRCRHGAIRKILDEVLNAKKVKN